MFLDHGEASISSLLHLGVTDTSGAAAEVPEVGAFLVVVLGVHPGVPESDVMIMVGGMNAGYDSAGWSVHRVNEPAAVIDRVDALRRRHLRYVVGENRCLSSHQGDRLLGLLEREALLGLCREQPEYEQNGWE